MRVLDGRYELVRFVGRGGMGEVWEGRDRVIDRRVAVKLLPHEPRDTSGAKLFFREARTAGALHHPGIVTVHDLGQDPGDGSLFLVMEFVEGRDLATVLHQDGPPSVAEAVGWAAQAAAALGQAHAAGIVHRDLKPANLMLTAAGQVKVLDFGIARFMESTNRSSKIMGTLAYMPPERFDEQPGDARSDLYSFGCVLHELITGETPFDATGPISMMNAHLHQPPPRPGGQRSGVPAELDDLVVRLLAKDPGQRPADAEEVHRLLREVSGDAPRSGTPDRRAGQRRSAAPGDPRGAVLAPPAPRAPNPRVPIVLAPPGAVRRAGGLATLRRRLAALVVDLAVLAGAFALAVMATLDAADGPAVLAALAAMLVGAGPELLTGVSWGKRLCGLRVVDYNSVPLAGLRRLVRSALRLVLGLPLLYSVLGVLIVLYYANRDTHNRVPWDRLTKSMVVLLPR